MTYLQPHLVIYSNGMQPRVVIFKNPDGSWGQNGELERYLGINRRENKYNDAGSSSRAASIEHLEAEASKYKQKYLICYKALEELRAIQKNAAKKLDVAIEKVKDGPVVEVGGPSKPGKRVVVDISDDGMSKNEVPYTTGRRVRTPYTRSCARRDRDRFGGRRP